MARKTITPDSVMVKGIKMKPMYNVNEITNRTNKNLWVVFPEGQESNGIVYSMVFSRDQVRCAGRKMFNTNMANIRSQRVSTYRKNM